LQHSATGVPQLLPLLLIPLLLATTMTMTMTMPSLSR
jgi:hypothetical protein